MNSITIARCSIAVFLVLVAAGCGADRETLTKEPPVVLSVSPDTAGSGDTVIVTGRGFNPDPSANRVVISQGRFSDAQSRRESVPIGGSSSRLVAVIPDGAFEGSLRVEDDEPLRGAVAFSVDPPPASSNAVPYYSTLSTGDVGKAFFAGPGYSFTLDGGTGGSDYLFVVFNSIAAPDNTYKYAYSIATQVHAPLPADALAGAGASGIRGADRSRGDEAAPVSLAPSAADPTGSRQRAFERSVRREMREHLRGAASDRARLDRAFRAAVEGPGEAPMTTAFQVLLDANGSVLDPGNFATIEADLRYVGTHTLLYVDQETPDAFLTQDDVDMLGASFDDTIYARNKDRFGDESDINHDGKVAILMSPAINRLTEEGSASTTGFIAGYFLWNDLLPSLVDSRTTNGMEVFYTIVPDPAGLYGNVFPRDRTLPLIESVLAHEFLHMILFNYRVLIYGRGVSAEFTEDLWMEEGLAHIAENLNGFETSNIARANLFLANPGDVTLIHGGDELKERGASFLFLRHLGDRFGDGIYRQLVQTKDIGTKNIEARTGAYFKEVFADWSAACYLSERGITDDPRFNYSTLSLRTDFKPLGVIAGSLAAGVPSREIRAMAPEFVIYSIPAATSVTFTIASDADGKMNAVVARIH